MEKLYRYPEWYKYDVLALLPELEVSFKKKEDVMPLLKKKKEIKGVKILIKNLTFIRENPENFL